MGLRYSTVTGVARDDQPDGAAGLYAETIRQIHALNPNTGVEILPPDFGAVPELVGQVFDARPEVFAHNLETVPRIFKRIRPAFTYDKSLRGADAWPARPSSSPSPTSSSAWARRTTRSRQAIRDLHDAGCDILTITQYLRPSKRTTRSTGGSSPRSSCTGPTSPRTSASRASWPGPLVRSSYRAGRLWATAMGRWGRPIPEHLAHLAERPRQTRPARRRRRWWRARRAPYPDPVSVTPMARKEKQQSDQPEEARPDRPDPPGLHRGSPGRPQHRLVDAAGLRRPSIAVDRRHRLPRRLPGRTPRSSACRSPCSRPTIVHEPPRRARGLPRARGPARRRRRRPAVAAPRLVLRAGAGRHRGRPRHPPRGHGRRRVRLPGARPPRHRAHRRGPAGPRHQAPRGGARRSSASPPACR